MSNNLHYLCQRKGKVVIISGPSGVGKTTICTAMLRTFPRLRWSVSATTRPHRPGEVEGKDYHFLSPENFLQKIKAGEFLEYAEVHGDYYGTLVKPIDEAIEAEYSCLLDIDVQGASKIKEQNKYDLVLIFIAPPSLQELGKRLLARGSNTPATIERRIYNATMEMEKAIFYHYRVVNERLAQTIKTVHEILSAEIS